MEREVQMLTADDLDLMIGRIIGAWARCEFEITACPKTIEHAVHIRRVRVEFKIASPLHIEDPNVSGDQRLKARLANCSAWVAALGFEEDRWAALSTRSQRLYVERNIVAHSVSHIDPEDGAIVFRNHDASTRRDRAIVAAKDKLSERGPTFSRGWGQMRSAYRQEGADRRRFEDLVAVFAELKSLNDDLATYVADMIGNVLPAPEARKPALTMQSVIDSR